MSSDPQDPAVRLAVAAEEILAILKSDAVRRAGRALIDFVQKLEHEDDGKQKGRPLRIVRDP